MRVSWPDITDFAGCVVADWLARQITTQGESTASFLSNLRLPLPCPSGQSNVARLQPSKRLGR